LPRSLPPRRITFLDRSGQHGRGIFNPEVRVLARGVGARIA
jgi:hypothetical protein